MFNFKDVNTVYIDLCRNADSNNMLDNSCFHWMLSLLYWALNSHKKLSCLNVTKSTEIQAESEVSLIVYIHNISKKFTAKSNFKARDFVLNASYGSYYKCCTTVSHVDRF